MYEGQRVLTNILGLMTTDDNHYIGNRSTKTTNEVFMALVTRRCYNQFTHLYHTEVSDHLSLTSHTVNERKSLQSCKKKKV